MGFFRYLRFKLRIIAAFTVFAAVLFVSFMLYGVPAEAYVYPAVICVCLGAAMLAAGYARSCAKCAKLSLVKSLSSDTSVKLPPPDAPDDICYNEIIEKLRSENSDIIAAGENKYAEMTEYYNTWAHQIKTPIASMKLTLENNDSPLSMKLAGDLTRISQYADMVLTYMRLESPDTDYVFREQPLDDIIKTSVRKFSGEFIAKHLRLDYSETGMNVLTDGKWLGFVIEQVLSNSLKYTYDGTIRIYSEENNVLCISDTGIGIAESDLPRIFESGYTGENGRTGGAASGIGLYLCKRISSNLGITINAESKVGKGTTIKLGLAKKRTRHE